MTIGARYAAALLVLDLKSREDGSIFLDNIYLDQDGTIYLDGTANQDGTLVIEYESQT